MLHYTALHSIDYNTLLYTARRYTTTTNLQLHYAATSATAALHRTTSSNHGWGDRPGGHCNQCNHSKRNNSNHLSVDYHGLPLPSVTKLSCRSPILKLLPPPHAVLLVLVLGDNPALICIVYSPIFMCFVHSLSCDLQPLSECVWLPDNQILTSSFSQTFLNYWLSEPWAASFWLLAILSWSFPADEPLLLWAAFCIFLNGLRVLYCSLCLLPWTASSAKHLAPWLSCYCVRICVLAKPELLP